MDGRMVAVVLWVALVASPLADGAGTPAEREPGAPGVAQQSGLGVSPDLLQLRVNELTGRPVENQFGDPLGEVTEVVIDPKDERLFAIIGIIGAFDMVEARAAVPLADMIIFNGRLVTESGLNWPELAKYYPHDQSRIPVQDDLRLSDVGGWWERRVYDELTRPLSRW